MGWLKDLGTSIGQTVGDVVNETVSNTSDIYSGYVELFGGESKEQIKNLLKITKIYVISLRKKKFTEFLPFEFPFKKVIV